MVLESQAMVVNLLSYWITPRADLYAACRGQAVSSLWVKEFLANPRLFWLKKRENRLNQQKLTQAICWKETRAGVAAHSRVNGNRTTKSRFQVSVYPLWRCVVDSCLLFLLSAGWHPLVWSGGKRDAVGWTVRHSCRMSLGRQILPCKRFCPL
jgi:hypothetical protein